MAACAPSVEQRGRRRRAHRKRVQVVVSGSNSLHIYRVGLGATIFQRTDGKSAQASSGRVAASCREPVEGRRGPGPPAAGSGPHGEALTLHMGGFPAAAVGQQPQLDPTNNLKTPKPLSVGSLNAQSVLRRATKIKHENLLHVNSFPLLCLWKIFP